MKIKSWPLSSIVSAISSTRNYLIHRIEGFFAWWAGLVYDHPYYPISITLIFTLLSCIGFIPGIPKWVDGADALYSLQYSVARSQGAIHHVLFNEANSRPSFIIITGAHQDQNIFTWEHLAAVKRLDKLIRGQITDPKHGRRISIPRSDKYTLPEETPKHETKVLYNPIIEDRPPVEIATDLPQNVNKVMQMINGRRSSSDSDKKDERNDNYITFQDLCVKNTVGECMVTGVQEMGVEETSELLSLKDKPPVLLVFDGLVFNPQKKAFAPHYLLGQAKEIPCSPDLPTSMLQLLYPPERIMPGSKPNFSKVNMTCIKEVKAFQLIYELHDNVNFKKQNEDWEKVMVDVLNDNKEFGPLRLSVNAFRSRDDALRWATSESSDILYVGVTFLLLMAYSTSMNFSCNLYRSKAYSAIAGLLAATFGLIAGMGILSLIGIAFVPTALVCPFLVIGVGTDDLFVIINSYALTYIIENPRNRCIATLRESGISISMTTLTSLITFLIGINSLYLSIRNFCWFSGAGMFFGYIFVFTFFFPIHCLDAYKETVQEVCLFTKKCRDCPKNTNIMSPDKISVYTLGALLVRREEHKAIKRVAIRQNLLENRETVTSEVDCNNCIKIPPSITDQSSQEQSIKKLSPFRRFINFVNVQSDLRLTAIALKADEVLKTYNFDGSPSSGRLNFNKINPKLQLTGNVMEDILKFDVVPLYYNSSCNGEQKPFIEEPVGNVGRFCHNFFIRYYGTIVVTTKAQMLIILLFSTLFAISVYGCFKLKSGLDLRDLAPKNTYLYQFDKYASDYFTEYDYPVYVFFPQPHEWWKKEAQTSLKKLETRMKNSGSGKLVTNPVLRMLEDPELKPFLQSGNQKIFESTLYAALSNERSKYKQFETNFVWEGNHLRAWKMQILPPPMTSSHERAAWMMQIRADCNEQLKDKDYPIVVMAWNYMMTFYESDLMVDQNVAIELCVAAATMLVISAVAISKLQSALLIVLVLGLIDVDIIGFMYFVNVKLNMVSMICLLIAIGFSIDFSAHICHTFTETKGVLSSQRVIETLVIMGTPVINGAFSSILGISVLGFSDSHIFNVFYKMMSLVMIFALAHGVILLPVLLSISSDYSLPSRKSIGKNEIQMKEASARLQHEQSNISSDTDASTNKPKLFINTSPSPYFSCPRWQKQQVFKPEYKTPQR